MQRQTSQLRRPLALTARLMAIVLVLGAGVFLSSSFAASAATSANVAEAGADSGSADPGQVPAPINDEILPPPAEPRVAPENAPPNILGHHGCAVHTACMWHYAHYDGKKHYAYPWMGGTGWRSDYPGYVFNSAKNRLGNRKFETGNAFFVTSCINPGGNRANLASSDRYHVGNAGSRC